MVIPRLPTNCNLRNRNVMFPHPPFSPYTFFHLHSPTVARFSLRRRTSTTSMAAVPRHPPPLRRRAIPFRHSASPRPGPPPRPPAIKRLHCRRPHPFLRHPLHSSFHPSVPLRYDSLIFSLLLPPQHPHPRLHDSLHWATQETRR